MNKNFMEITRLDTRNNFHRREKEKHRKELKKKEKHKNDQNLFTQGDSGET